MDPKDSRLALRLTADEYRMMAELSEREGLTMTDTFRVLVRRVHAETFGATTSKPKSRKRSPKK